MAPSRSGRKNSGRLWLHQPYGYSRALADDRFNSHAASRDRGFLLTRVRGDVHVASLRRLSVAVALSSPRADTQILSRNSLAQCLMVHQHQVQRDTEAPVCAPSSQLLSTVTGPSVTKCCAVTPVLEHYPQHIYDLNEPTSFLLSINNWTATEGAFSTAIWRGTRVAEFTQRVKMHVGKLCQTEYSCCWGGCKFTHALLWRLFPFLGICIEPNPLNLFWAAHDIQTRCKYVVSAVSKRSSFSPHSHLQGCIWLLLTTGHSPALHFTSCNTLSNCQIRHNAY